MTAITIKQALRMASHALAGSDTVQVDAELLLSRALDKPRSHLYSWPERLLSPSEHSCFDSLLERRVLGEPMAYILGTRDFWTLTLHVNRHVLIPRPETELLVEAALSLAGVMRVADLGTGSGAIALALAAERPGWRLIATDTSIDALIVASDNATRLGIQNVEFHRGNWCNALPSGQFDLIVSNPPYIDPDDPHLSQGDLRFEPATALTALDNGLADIRAICMAAPDHLKPGGWLLLEHGWTQGPAVAALLEQCGFQEVRTLKDLNANDRVTLGSLAC
ncbi:MAG: peptide chain release factor N(5)-glutamine methyltransferase [Gammaproteobacteria bacterium]|nr:peptide chain release factor N(5)-glutamine methyltransferase [Gammaproteobacteria bacterium]MDP2142304.1 peptide chain release factor N(5)-glutamine methyltransferase [Gammaproteobacteria bacterium]MDP2348545.1 peptide chain release factor N(5)-glutamine methyltransferase [Gammaproteobacteria bacterium]